MGDEAEEVEADERRQLRSPACRCERLGRFDDLQIRRARRGSRRPDLEAVRRRRGAKRGDGLAADHEEAAHRVANVGSRDAAEEPGAEYRSASARRRQTLGRFVVGDAGADRRDCRARRAPRTSSAGPIVVLQIAVDHRDEIGARRQPAFDHRAGKTDPIDAPDAADARIGFRGPRRCRRCRRANRRRRRSFPRASPRESSSTARTGPERWPLRDRSARPRRGLVEPRESHDVIRPRPRRASICRRRVSADTAPERRASSRRLGSSASSIASTPSRSSVTICGRSKRSK